MKQLTCEMCGSTDMMKQDGVFVCQTCGTKYSVEEAKKMMVEGTVDVTGSTVKVDNTASIGNYLIMAKNAYDVNNLNEAETYCNKIIEIEPTNYEAWLLKGCVAGWQSTLANIRFEEAIKCFTKAIDYSPEEKADEVKNISSDEIAKLSLALVSLSCESYGKHGSLDTASTVKKNVQTVKLLGFQFIEKNGKDVTNLSQQIATEINNGVNAAYKYIWENYEFYSSKSVCYTFTEKSWEAINLIDLAMMLSSEASIECKKNLYKKKIEILYNVKFAKWYVYRDGAWRNGTLVYTDEERTKIVDIIMDCHNKVKELDPNYEIPSRPLSTPAKGCYVATAVYGSYDCPQVWTLRRYRDYTLAQSWHGRAFIRTYYAISPTLVKWFGDTEWFKKMWKGKLDRMVENLQADGVESTPYEDRNW